MYSLQYNKADKSEALSLQVPSGKSASNRALIIRALSEHDYDIHNLSTARDTRILNDLLESPSKSYNAQDAGTVMRFLTAFLALKTKKTCTLSGTERAHERPIGILVRALRELGAEIEYLEKDGFPPLRIHPSGLNKSSEIEISGSISSQFISAIMMIAPLLDGGLTIRLLPPILSEPYIQLTLDMMHYQDIEAAYVNNLIRINTGKYSSKEYLVESDWSSAVFLYGLCLSSGNNIFIPGLKLDSIQADSEIQFIMKELGVSSEQKDDGVLITNSGIHPECIHWDCTDYPDLVPGLCFSLAARGIQAKITGTSHLKHKESDRAEAIKTELEKIGLTVELQENQIKLSGKINADSVEFNTYRDHRMAMSAAIVSPVIDTIEISDPEVVEKSYPEFWSEIEKMGIILTNTITEN